MAPRFLTESENVLARRFRLLTTRRAVGNPPEFRLGRPARSLRLAAAAVVTSASVLAICITTVLGPGAAAADASVRATNAHLAFTPSPSPAYGNDAADPDVVYSGGTYYAFTTGTPLGNHIQALTSGSPASGWQPFTGGFGSSALPNPPAWETSNTQTSPGVFFYGGHWVMFYDAALSPHAEDSGYSCLSVATTTTLPVFTDGSAGPLTCGTPGVGVLDPSPFVNPATGVAYLLWKSNDGASGAASADLVRPAERRRHQHRGNPHRPVDRRPAGTAVGDDHGRPPDGLRLGLVRPALLGRELRINQLQRSADPVWRSPRALQPTSGALPHDVRHRLWTRRRVPLSRRRWELVARVRGLVGIVHLLRIAVQCGAAAVHGPDRPRQRPRRTLQSARRASDRLPLVRE